MFDSLLEESRFVRKKRVEGKMEGKIEGTIDTLHQVIVEFVQTRFPTLTTMAQQKMANVNEPQLLYGLIMQLATVDHEEDAQKLLSMLDH